MISSFWKNFGKRFVTVIPQDQFLTARVPVFAQLRKSTAREDGHLPCMRRICLREVIASNKDRRCLLVSYEAKILSLSCTKEGRLLKVAVLYSHPVQCCVIGSRMSRSSLGLRVFRNIPYADWVKAAGRVVAFYGLFMNYVFCLPHARLFQGTSPFIFLIVDDYTQ